MAINSPADLFAYELSGMHDAEKKSAAWTGEMIGQIQDANLQKVMRVEQQEGQQRIKNLEACFQAMGTQPRDAPALVIDGMRAEHQQFMNLQPSPQAMDMYTLGYAMRMSYFGIGSYKSLAYKSVLMRETQCAQLLRSNLVMKEENAGRLERLTHEMGLRIMAYRSV